ncbi:MAG: SsrA-binding protein SmpB [Fastidiosipilaceae bacterium]
MARARGIKIVAKNRKARHDYHILETYEAGIALKGTEVKSIRSGAINLADSYAQIKNGELFLIGCHISPYEHGNRFNVDTLRERKLLMHRHEIDRLDGKLKEQGLTLVPLEIYFKNGKVKLGLGLAKGKRDYDKRQALAKRQAERDIDRSLKEFNR